MRFQHHPPCQDPCARTNGFGADCAFAPLCPTLTAPTARGRPAAVAFSSFLRVSMMGPRGDILNRSPGLVGVVRDDTPPLTARTVASTRIHGQSWEGF